MHELLRAAAALRRRLDQLGARRDAEALEAVAEGCFRLAVHPGTAAGESIDLLRRAARVDGGNPRYAYHLGRIYLRHGRLELAGEHLRAASKLCPTSHRLWIHVSLLQRELNERYRGDPQRMQDDLRKRARVLAGEVRDGADRVAADLLDLEPRFVRGDGRPPANDEDAWSEARRRQDAGRCRWRGVVELLAEQDLEAEPTARAGRELAALLDEVAAVADERRGGRAALAILAVEWLLRGYPPAVARRHLDRLAPEDDAGLRLVAEVCELMEAAPEELPRRLAAAVEEGRMPPLAAALVHARRLLWRVPELGVLGAAVRRAREALRRPLEADEAAALAALLDRAARELQTRPPATVEELPEERPDGVGVDERLARLAERAAAADAQVRDDRKRLQQLTEAHQGGGLDASGRDEVAGIARRHEALMEECDGVIKELDTWTLAPGDEAAAERLGELKSAYRDLVRTRGRFGKALRKLPRSAAKAAEPTADTARAAAPSAEPPPSEEPPPEEPVALLRWKLERVERQVRERFADAERTFAAYDGALARHSPLAALRRVLRARRAETVYRLGHRREARRLWIGLLRDDPLDETLLKNVAVCDTVRGALGRQPASWRSYLEILCFYDVVAGSPRLHAAERAAFHRDFGAAYAPARLLEESLSLQRLRHEDPGAFERLLDETTAFLLSGRVGTFVSHKLLEILSRRCELTSPPLILGVDRSADEATRERARERTLGFVDEVTGLLPPRVRAAFADLVRGHVERAYEATRSVRRLTLRRDPSYGPDKERYAGWLRELIELKVTLFNLVKTVLDRLGEPAALAAADELRRLDRVPIDNSPELLRQFGDHWQDLVGLLGSLKPLIVLIVARKGHRLAVRPHLPEQLENPELPPGVLVNLLQVTLAAEVAAAEKLAEDLGDETFADALERWLRSEGQEPATRGEAAGAELDACRRGLEAVEHRLGREREKLAAEEPGELLGADLDALAEQLDHARVKVFLEPFLERYRAVMEGVRDGLRDVAQAEEIGRELEEVASTIDAAEPLLGESKTLRDFRTRVGESLEGVREARHALGEADLVNAHGERFQRLIETFKSGDRKADDVEILRAGLRELDGEVRALRRAAESEQGKKALDDLAAAIAQVLEQTGE